VGNPEEMDIGGSMLAGYKTGMQAMLSEVIDQKAQSKTKRTNDILTNIGMKTMGSV
jgi:hypothetical protein